jgi:hypothetical protein
MRNSKVLKDKLARLTEILSDHDQIKQLLLGEKSRTVPSVQANLSKAADDADFPPDIAEWLGLLRLLYGVPFNYLVPDEKMLPPESIRFFYIDSAWIDCLLQGAISIGRTTKADLAHDRAFVEKVHAHSANSALRLRASIIRRPIPVNTVLETLNKAAGFLLRSSVVNGWPGLEIQAYKDSPVKNECKLLRMEHLAPDILLCFYEDIIKELHIHEHPEGLHFGVSADDKNPVTYSKSLKYITEYR